LRGARPVATKPISTSIVEAPGFTGAFIRHALCYIADMSLKDHVIIVTGAAGNLGAAIAANLAQSGALLILADVRAEPLEALAASIDTPSVIVAGADVRTKAGCAAIVAAGLEKFGQIDGLANTVGTFKMTDIAEDAAKDWAFLMELNALSALELTQAVLAPMRARGYGRIVHTAAGAALKSFAGAAVYAASKAAVLRIVEATAQENAAHGVTCNAVMPGTIDTPQNRAAMPDANFSTWVAPSDLAAVFAFLVSPQSGAVNGAGVLAAGRGA
jgi:NAD(P)-dependent dehydrogenase (short-subunit alcohol dehydrogenase family)